MDIEDEGMRSLAKKSLFVPSIWLTQKSMLMQAAIDMVNVELKYGSYLSLLDIAHNIIASQSKDLVDFKRILFEQYAVSA